MLIALHVIVNRSVWARCVNFVATLAQMCFVIVVEYISGTSVVLTGICLPDRPENVYLVCNHLYVFSFVRFW